MVNKYRKSRSVYINSNLYIFYDGLIHFVSKSYCPFVKTLGANYYPTNFISKYDL